MEEYLTQIKDWIISLGEKHHVNPLLLGSLYLVSKVSLITFLAWAVKNYRLKKPIIILLLLAAISFSLPYLYLIIAGRNIPVWVYLFIGMMFIYSGYTIWIKITKKPVDIDETPEDE